MAKFDDTQPLAYPFDNTWVVVSSEAYPSQTHSGKLLLQHSKAGLSQDLDRAGHPRHKTRIFFYYC